MRRNTAFPLFVHPFRIVLGCFQTEILVGGGGKKSLYMRLQGQCMSLSLGSLGSVPAAPHCVTQGGRAQCWEVTCGATAVQCPEDGCSRGRMQHVAPKLPEMDGCWRMGMQTCKPHCSVGVPCRAGWMCCCCSGQGWQWCGQRGSCSSPVAGACKGQDDAQLWGAGASLASCRLGSGSVQLAQLLARKSCRLMLEVVGVQDL